MSSPITTKEKHLIRKSLALRFNLIDNCYEVYTTIHGTGIFKWFRITDDVADWYKKTFGLSVSQYLHASTQTGGLMEIPANSPKLGGNP